MLRQVLLSKIHRARVTGADIEYVGSITLDSELMRAAGIIPWERVQVVDVDNGARLETYVIEGDPGSGQVQMNGAAAHLIHADDTVIIMAYALLNEQELETHRPTVVFVDDQNHISAIRAYEVLPE